MHRSAHVYTIYFVVHMHVQSISICMYLICFVVYSDHSVSPLRQSPELQSQKEQKSDKSNKKLLKRGYCNYGLPNPLCHAIARLSLL